MNVQRCPKCGAKADLDLLECEWKCDCDKVKKDIPKKKDTKKVSE